MIEPVGDIVDAHSYPHPAFPFDDNRYRDFIKVMGEFGGHDSRRTDRRDVDNCDDRQCRRSARSFRRWRCSRAELDHALTSTRRLRVFDVGPMLR